MGILGGSGNGSNGPQGGSNPLGVGLSPFMGNGASGGFNAGMGGLLGNTSTSQGAQGFQQGQWMGNIQNQMNMNRPTNYPQLGQVQGNYGSTQPVQPQQHPYNGNTPNATNTYNPFPNATNTYNPTPNATDAMGMGNGSAAPQYTFQQEANLGIVPHGFSMNANPYNNPNGGPSFNGTGNNYDIGSYTGGTPTAQSLFQPGNAYNMPQSFWNQRVSSNPYSMNMYYNTYQAPQDDSGYIMRGGNGGGAGGGFGGGDGGDGGSGGGGGDGGGE